VFFVLLRSSLVASSEEIFSLSFSLFIIANYLDLLRISGSAGLRSLRLKGFVGSCQFVEFVSGLLPFVALSQAQPQPNCAKRMECARLAGAFWVYWYPSEREQAPRTPYASRT
jgi:hypothetical protein